MGEDFNFNCLDCMVNTCPNTGIAEYYMVHNEVWTAAGMPFAGELGGGILCIGCLEKRLGRELRAADFIDFPINHGFFNRSDRMLDRLDMH